MAIRYKTSCRKASTRACCPPTRRITRAKLRWNCCRPVTLDAHWSETRYSAESGWLIFLLRSHNFFTVTFPRLNYLTTGLVRRGRKGGGWNPRGTWPPAEIFVRGRQSFWSLSFPLPHPPSSSHSCLPQTLSVFFVLSLPCPPFHFLFPLHPALSFPPRSCCSWTQLGDLGSDVSSRGPSGFRAEPRPQTHFWSRETCPVTMIWLFLYEPKCYNWSEFNLYIFQGRASVPFVMPVGPHAAVRKKLIPNKVKPVMYFGQERVLSTLKTVQAYTRSSEHVIWKH